MKKSIAWGWLGVPLLAGLSVAVPGLADVPAHSETVCTVTVEVDLESEEVDPVTECIHIDEQGSSTTAFSDSLYLQLASTRCFYFGNQPTQWVNLSYDEDGWLEYGWSPNGRPGGHIVIGKTQPCSWARVEREEIEGYVWSRIGSYTHQSPQVSFDPPVPRGMVGIETFAALSVPSPWTFSSISPYTESSLRAEVKVRQVLFDWDDGHPQVFSGSDLSEFTGYPEGVANHTYQTKSCLLANPRCREELGAYEVETVFRWSGWYRVGSRKRNLSIPNTSSSTDYAVSEIIPLVVG